MTPRRPLRFAVNVFSAIHNATLSPEQLGHHRKLHVDPELIHSSQCRRRAYTVDIRPYAVHLASPTRLDPRSKMGSRTNLVDRDGGVLGGTYCLDLLFD